MGISRRKLLQVTGAATVGAAFGMHRQVFAQGGKKKLKILQWSHFVPGYDKWFNGEYIKQWGEKNNTEVIVDNVGIPALNPTAASEVSAKKGHDLFGFLSPRPAYENDVIDHKRDLRRSARRSTARRSTSRTSPRSTRRRRSTSPSPTPTSPDPGNYRKDPGTRSGSSPTAGTTSASAARRSGRRPASRSGIGLSRSSTRTWRCARSSGPSAARAGRRATSPQLEETVEAVKFVKALYKEAETPEVFTWDSSSNNRGMLAGRSRVAQRHLRSPAGPRTTSCRSAEDLARRRLKGPVRRIAAEHVMSCYVIWEFAENKDGAKQFLVDYIGELPPGVRDERVLQLPLLPDHGAEPQAARRQRPEGDADGQVRCSPTSLDWATNVGYPGYATAAIDEVFNTWVIPTMFAKAAAAT